ncbi:MAG: glycosyltransferase family 39 protein [Elioraea sp.]|nr:glycosyltransferase family 39 protein [Elioraea sp.]
MPALRVVLVLTLARVVWLGFNEPNLYADEAQYWIWAQSIAGGYYSKPPLIAWTIAGVTALCGETEACIRLFSPLAHAATALILAAAANRLFDSRTGFWTAVLYSTLPAVSVSAAIASTDALLLPAWAAGLHALVRLREAPSLAWWAVLGLAVGMGMLAKYTMAGFLLSLALWWSVERGPKPALTGPGPWLALGLALLVLSPNLVWNALHGFATVRHVGENTNLARGAAFNPGEAAEFLGAQFGVFGPLTFALLLWILSRRDTWRDGRTRLLALFVVPLGALMLGQSFLSRANANWAAPIYAAGSILVAAWAVARARTLLLQASVALHVAAALLIFAGPPALAAAGVELPRRFDPWMRQRGYDVLGQAIMREAAPHPDARFLFDQRRDMASLIYYIRPHPFDARMWEPDGVARNTFEQTAPLKPGDRGPFLYVTRREDPAEVLSRFERAERLARLVVPTHRDAALRYTLWRLDGFRGYRD